MRELTSAPGRIAAFTGIVLAGSIGNAAALELITAQEAALPDPVGLNLNLDVRGVTRGPKVVVISPAPGAGTVKSPLNLVLQFQSHGGTTIDQQFVKLIYLKIPAVNLTPRLGDLIKADGIEVHGAEVPAGIHYLKVEVMDSAGRLGSTTFALMVTQ
jgi:hypothetical protein